MCSGIGGFSCSGIGGVLWEAQGLVEFPAQGLVGFPAQGLVGLFWVFFFCFFFHPLSSASGSWVRMRIPSWPQLLLLSAISMGLLRGCQGVGGEELPPLWTAPEG